MTTAILDHHTTMIDNGTHRQEAEDLVAAARDGSLDAFNRMVEANQGIVYAVCWRLLNNRQAAEDAVQETFIAAWRNIENVRPETFRSWLLTIAANVSKSQIRHHRRRPSVSLELAAETQNVDPLDEHDGPEEVVLNAEVRREVAYALQQVPLAQREAVVLWHFAGLDYAEIARVTSTSMGTVKSRINRGRRLTGRFLKRHSSGEYAPAGTVSATRGAYA